MLKRIVAAGAVLALGAAPLAAQAGSASQAKDMTVTGTVVDVSCFTLSGATGDAHKACAQACADKGIALGILASDGTIYLPLGSGMANPQNPKLRQYAEGKVKVTGTHRFANGLHTIEVKTIEAAM